MKLYYGMYYECLTCNEERVTREEKLPERCPKCNKSDFGPIRLKRFDDIPADTDQQTKVEMLFYRLMATLSAVQRSASDVLTEYKHLKKTFKDEKD